VEKENVENRRNQMQKAILRLQTTSVEKESAVRKRSPMLNPKLPITSVVKENVVRKRSQTQNRSKSPNQSLLSTSVVKASVARSNQ